MAEILLVQCCPLLRFFFDVESHRGFSTITREWSGWMLRYCFDFVAVLSGVVWPRLITIRVELCCHVDAPIQLA